MPNKRDAIGSPEDSIHAVAPGVMRAEGGGFRRGHLQHVVWVAAQGCNEPAPLDQIIVDSQRQGDVAIVHA